MTIEKKTRGPRKKRPPVMMAVPTQEGLINLQHNLRQLAEQHPSQEDQQTFKRADDVLDLLLQTQPWRTKDGIRDEITRTREYYLDIEMSQRARAEPGQRKTVKEVCEAVAKKLKNTSAGGVEWGAIKKLHDRINRDIKRGDRQRPWWWPSSGT